MNKNFLGDFVVQFWSDGAWVNVTSADVSGNKARELVLAFDATIPVVTDRIRLLSTAPADRTANVCEIRVRPSSEANVPPLPIKPDLLSPVSLCLKQSDFKSLTSERLTAPYAPDDAVLVIHHSVGGNSVFIGTIQDHVAT
jgi:hypothetical protein